MSREEAITLMKSSQNIKQWNDNRETVKEAFGVTNNFAGVLTCEFETLVASPIPIIDTSGLIVKVLKKN